MTTAAGRAGARKFGVLSVVLTVLGIGSLAVGMLALKSRSSPRCRRAAGDCSVNSAFHGELVDRQTC